MTTPCDSQFCLFLTFLCRRLYSKSSDSVVSCNDSHQILRDYAIREINLLLWISFFGITVLLVRKIVLLLKLWSHGGRIPGPPSPSFYGHSVLLTGANPHEDLTAPLWEKYHNRKVHERLLLISSFRATSLIVATISSSSPW
ncbi:uncharacterized protein LOC130818871 isoform X1 [Amaranthus tricolor]|uniref:uncharacterized protein LOC130818871 isoform X1 n=1 Tax=Amaranthus tricolor TaxID=29722 RepID=UPI0025829AF7|nr:uncharacterized protein LOC130818871 isoform X1 [Amaranthus tricolor]